MTPKQKLEFELSDKMLELFDQAQAGTLNISRGDLQGIIKAMAIDYISRAVNLK